MKEVLNSAPKFVLSGRDFISPSTSLLFSSIQMVYSNLADLLNQVVYSAFVAKTLEWEYELDKETGLEILKVKKHPESLNFAQELADEIF